MILSCFTRLLVFAAILIAADPVLAQYENGQAAFDNGDYLAAQSAWQNTADDPRCQYGLGYLLQFGLTGPADPMAAKGWYEKSANAKNGDALYALGLMFETGQAGEKDLSRAIDYYRQAAATGPQPDAEYALGRMLLRGRGIPRDAKQSVEWLKKAALHNNPAAQYMLAESFEAGWGLPVDDGQAYYWYRRAEQGNPEELADQDVAFSPKIALAALRKRLTPEAMAEWDARLKKDSAPSGKSSAKAAEKPSKQMGPSALTRPAE